MKPLVINLQINVYPDGTVAVAPLSPNAASELPAASTTQITPTLPSATPAGPPSTPVPPAGGAPSSGSGDTGPSEADVRTALLAAVKATTKASAVGVLEQIAGVTRVPDVPAELRAAVITQLGVLAATAAAE